MDDDKKMAQAGRALGSPIQRAAGCNTMAQAKRARTQGELLGELVDAVYYLMADFESYCKANRIACPSDNFAHRNARAALLNVGRSKLFDGNPYKIEGMQAKAVCVDEFVGAGMLDPGHNHTPACARQNDAPQAQRLGDLFAADRACENKRAQQQPPPAWAIRNDVVRAPWS